MKNLRANVLFNILFFIMISFFFVSSAGAWNALVIGGRCQASHQPCRSTVGNAGGAGACCDPMSAKIFYCISNNACLGGSPYAWHSVDLPLKWSLNDNNLPDSFAKHTIAQYEAALKKAWDGWTKPACTSFRHQYLGRGTQTGSKVTINLPSKKLWAAMGVGSSVLAFAQPRPQRDGRLYRGSIYVNPYHNWGIPSGNVTSTQYDFTEVLHHEMGHILGFAHTPYRTAVMYFQAQSPGPNYNGPQPDDIEAVCHTYPRRGKKICKNDLDCGGCGKCQQGSCSSTDGKISGSCSTNSECQKDLICKNFICQKAQGGTELDKCSTKIPCKSGYSCIRTIQGHVCLQMCKESAAFPPGSPGSTCNIDGSCPKGNECHLLQTGRTVCLRTCKQQSDCTGGGECLEIDLQGQRQKFCLCSKTKGCKNGNSCNNSYLGSDIGVCSKKITTTAKCRTGFVCKALANQHTACLPSTGTQGVGAKCNALLLCQKGLTCSLLSATSNKLVCVEDCTSTSICSLRGRCRPVDNHTRQCFCYDSGGCGSGRTCEMDVHGRGVCTAPPNICGNAVCEPKNGEDCVICPKDCQCSAGTICNKSTKKCEKAFFCGNGKCEQTNKENCSSCPQDCKCDKGQICENSVCQKAKSCGDNICQRNDGETCNSCPQDCGCGDQEVCQFGLCIKVCGDGTCDPKKKENCSTCPQDCQCNDSQTCQSGVCKTKTIQEKTISDAGSQDNNLNCPANQQKTQCDENGKSCKKVCDVGGCGCSTQPHNDSFFLLFLGLFALLLLIPRYQRR